ncbi:hypothetical protein BsWGS_19864 [Bradybaena similaris]
MNKSEDLLLLSFGISAHILHDGITAEIIKQIAVKIKELSQLGDVPSLIVVTNKLLAEIEDAKYSPIWVVLLDGLSHFSHQENVQAIYHQLVERQTKTFSSGSLPVDILYKLWLSHLPSLEAAVMALVEHICSDEHLPHTAMIQESLVKSFLVEIASSELVIYQTVYRMLMSLIISSDFAVVLIEITANFCWMVRHRKTKLSFQKQLWNTQSLQRSTRRIESLFKSSCDPQTIPSTSVAKTLCEIHRLWTNDGQKATELPESSKSLIVASEDAMDQKFEELWCLTVEYRNWITAALNVVLSCDEHPLEDALTSFVKELRGHLHISFQHSEQTSWVKELAGTCLTLESKIPQMVEEKEKQQRVIVSSRYVVNQILMAFFFQADNAFTAGDDLLMFVTSSKDVYVQVRCLIYHYYLLNVTTKRWSSAKCDCFLSLVTGLQLSLEKENTTNCIPDFVHLHSELKSISTVR